MTNEQKSELTKKSWLKLTDLEYLNVSYNKMGPELIEVIMGPNFGLFPPTL